MISLLLVAECSQRLGLSRRYIGWQVTPGKGIEQVMHIARKSRIKDAKRVQ